MKNYKHSTRNYVSILALTIALTGTPQAFAQSSSDTNMQKRDEIIVTARKRDETLLEVPISVTAFNQGDLDKLGITSAEALSQATPGFDFQNVGTGGQSGRANPQVRFRGVGLQIADPNAPVAGVFWDGVYVPQGIGLVPLIDLEQVEVIKGPQTAFFGRNTFAGAANFKPAIPTDEWEARIAAEGSRTDVDTGYFVNGTVSSGLSDNFRARLTVSTEKTPAAHEFADGSPLGEENTDAIQGSIDFDVSDSITLSYTGYYVDANDSNALSSINADNANCDRTYEGTLANVVTGERLGNFSTDLSANGTGNFPFGPFFNVNNPAGSTLFCGEIPEWSSANQINPAFSRAPTVNDFSDIPAGFGAFGPTPAQSAQAQFVANSFFDNVSVPAGTGSAFRNGFVEAPRGLGNTYRTWRNNFSITADIGGGFTLDGVVSKGRFMNWGTFDSAYGAGAVPTYAGFINNTDDQSAEIRITSPGEDKRLRYSVGVNYQTQESDAFQAGFNILSSTEAETLGIFGSADFDITNEITVSGEGRWQDDQVDLLQDGVPGSTFATQTRGFKKFMPRVILSYQPEGLGLNLFGSWSQSYLPGNATSATSYAAALLADAQAVDPTATQADTGFDPNATGFFTPNQKLDAFEVGLKHELGSMLSYSISGYKMDWENQVFFVLSPSFVSLAQPGDSEYLGVEAEVEFKPSPWLSLEASFNYVDGTFTDYIATGSVAGAVLAPGIATFPGTPGPINNTTAISADGNQIRYNPSTTGIFSAEVGLDHLINLDSFLRVDAIYTGKFFIDNFEYNQVDSSVRINLRAGAQINDTFGFELYGTNITDDLTPTTQGGTTFTSFFSQNTRRFFGQAPRGAEYGLKFIATF